MLILAGCGSDLPSASFIDKLRVLAVQAEPPEVAPGEPTTLRALVVQPVLPSPAPSTDAIWLACTPPPGSLQDVPCGVNDKTIPPVIGTGREIRYTPDGSSEQMLLTVIVADNQKAIDCLRGIQERGGLPKDPDHCVVTFKRLPVTGGTNQNPAMTSLTLNDQPIDGTAQFPIDGSTMTLKITRGDGSAEKDAAGNYEALSVSWFTTSGKIDGGRSQFDVAGCAAASDCPMSEPVKQSTTKWIVPSAEQLGKTANASKQVHFWAVVRDDHGGVSWLDGDAVPKP
jgi:hypothetical protein